MRKIYKSLLIALSIFIITNANAQNYHLGDSMAIQTIMANNFTGSTLLNWTDPDPSAWIGVTWNSASPKRIIELNLANGTSRNGGRNDDGTASNQSQALFTVLSGPYTVHGATTDLKGNIDFTNFSELEEILLNGNSLVTGIEISGLTKLKKVRLGKTSITSIDASNLTALTNLHAKVDAVLTSVNVSGCTNLARLKINSSGTYNSNFNFLDITGCTNLEQLNIKGSAITSLNLTGLTKLNRFNAQSSSVSNITGLTSCTNLTSFGIATTPLAGALNLTGLSLLQTVGAKDNTISDFIGIENLSSLTAFNASQDRLPLDRAVQAKLVPVTRLPNNAPDPVANETPYGTSFIEYTDSVDYSALDSIDVNGTMISTTFTLFNGATPVDTNTTGIFNFVIGDIGNVYTLEMVNSGVTITTGNINITAACVRGPHHAGDSAVIATIAANNFSGSTGLNWTSTCPASWIGVVWDTMVTPYRITELNLAYDGASGGDGNNSNLNGNNASNVTGGIIYSVNSIAFPVTGANPDLQGSVDFSGLSELKKLILNDNEGITAINVSGLNKLEYLYVGNTGITTLDASGLTGLLQVKASMGQNSSSPLTSINVSACSNLVRLKAYNNAQNLSSVNVSGCTKLEQLNIKEAPKLTSLDLTGISSLLKLAVGNRGNTAGGLNALPTNLYANTKLKALGLSSQNIAGTIDFSVFDSLHKFSVYENKVTTITGAFGLTKLEYHSGGNNRLSLTNAVEMDNNTAAGSQGTNITQGNFQYEMQQNDGMGILWTDSVDYSIHDSINVAGTMTASTFTLYKYPTASVYGTNSTGIFNFTIADTGKYYAEMTNSNVTVTTDTIYVLNAAGKIVASISAFDFGNVLVGNSKVEVLKVNNEGNAVLNVSDITIPNGYSISGTTASIPVGDSATFNLTFSPLDTIVYSGAVTVSSNQTTLSGTETVNITGKGYVFGVGINDIAQSSISFYPNPTSSILYIKNNDGAYKLLSLYSIEGVLVKTINISQSQYIDMSELSQGVYFIQSEDRVVNQKIIKF